VFQVSPAKRPRYSVDCLAWEIRETLLSLQISERYPVDRVSRRVIDEDLQKTIYSADSGNPSRLPISRLPIFSFS